jgi:hypothetical protein
MTYYVAGLLTGLIVGFVVAFLSGWLYPLGRGTVGGR